jgi:hypothetical protein
MTNSIVEQEDRSWLYSTLVPVHEFWMKMQLEDIQESNHFCVDQNISVLFLIYDAVLLYPETDNTLEIFCVSVLDNLERCLHQTSHTV